MVQERSKTEVSSEGCRVVVFVRRVRSCLCVRLYEFMVHVYVCPHIHMCVMCVTCLYLGVYV